MPLVGTFHCYSKPLANGDRRNGGRAAPLQQAACAHRRVGGGALDRERYYGGRYRIVPNGVDLAAARPEHHARARPARLLFLGRADDRKGLPVLLRAFEALRAAGVPARLTVAGATRGGRSVAARPGGRDRGGPRDRGEK